MIYFVLYNFIGGKDYVSGTYIATIHAQHKSGTFDIQILDDGVDEGIEFFNLKIDPSTLPDGILTDGVTEAKVIIIDDECK